MKRLFSFVGLFLVVGWFWGYKLPELPTKVKPVKNVIILIPDGMSMGGYTLARWYKNGAPLAMDDMACGLVRTYSSDAVIADSAPAATAYACGVKAVTKNIGVMPQKAGMPGVPAIVRGEENRPIANVFEAARLIGKSTGLVFTCEAPHATPAAYSAHSPDRKLYDDILEQQVYTGLDVVFGGGWKFMTSETRQDKENLLAIVQSNYIYISNRAQLLALRPGKKVWGMFAPVDLPYEIDRDKEKDPSLAEMTAKAIEVLSANPKGFVLMVEGSKIDWAAHANDPVALIHDILAFDEAVRTAKEFAQKDKNTVVIVLTDHGNGGITIGNSSSDNSYDKLKIHDVFRFIKSAKTSGENLKNLIASNSSPKEIRKTVASYYGIPDLSDEEVQEIQKASTKGSPSLSYIVGPMLSKRSYIGWTTHGHTGEDVPLFIYSPRNDHPTGTLENTQIAVLTANYLRVSLSETTRRLFVEAIPEFEKKGASVETDTTDPNNPVLTVKKGNTTLRFPVNKNIAFINNQTVTLPGVTVYINKKWYLSQDGLNLLK
ncbi:alkaline phosphatase [Thermospira aquatica]|uniref:Alkaline phosphatase n=1 Tax=Thermospira aquatica TaxID=2828656 RepID=A0AAX3BDA1_9SPIR|nr:alkaline phosphatase [Thermospira aquatica]URA10227.1 alkaline phosphatase [Thermospira aquatica]